MPLHVSVEKFADGRAFIRTVSSGQVTAADARALMARVVPGAELAGLPLLAVMEGKVDLAPEARKIFGSLNAVAEGEKLRVAVVTSSAPLRVMLSFVLRIAGQADATKFFATEAEARGWLESP